MLSFALLAAGLALGAPPSTALTTADAAGDRLAVWTNPAGALVHSISAAGSELWAPAHVVYAPAPPTCARPGECIVETVQPVSLSSNARGDAFLVVRDDVNGPRPCVVVRVGRGSITATAHRDQLAMTDAAPPRPACQGHGGQPGTGRLSAFVSTVAPDGAAALAYLRLAQASYRVAFAAYGVDGSISVDEGTFRNHPQSDLQLAIAPSGRTTVLWRAPHDHAHPVVKLQSADFGAGLPALQIDVTRNFGVRQTGLRHPVLGVGADGAQTVIYDGHALVDGLLVRTTVSQSRPGPDAAWSDPVPVP